MKTYLDCIPCFMQQALRAGRMATRAEHLLKRILDETGEMIKNLPMQSTPAESGLRVYRTVKELTGVRDPYKAVKAAHIEEAKTIYPELTEIMDQSDDRLRTAIKIAIAGNVIDLGINRTLNLVGDVRKSLAQEFAILDYNAFKKRLATAKSILYLGDNAGESVFDKILIRELKKGVTYAVRSAPIINDVTMEEAVASGLDEVAELVDSGSEAPGVIFKMCTPDFRQRFDSADLIISKGQGNYEGLSGCHRPIFFLLKAKCVVVANHLAVKKGDIVVKHMQPNPMTQKSK